MIRINKLRYCSFAAYIVCIVLATSACEKKDVDERFSKPLKTYSVWLETSLDGDIPRNMECMTKASQKFMDIQAKDRDLFIERMVTSAAIFKNYSVSDEKIRGDLAVVVIREPKSGQAIAVPFKFEDGGWKVDLISMFSGMVAAGG